jgi:acetyltransferase
MVRFSQLVVEQRFIKEIDINPLLASHERLLALDARVVLHEPEVREEDLPHTAIRPYPRRYFNRWTMKNGEEVTIRPIRPEDEPKLVGFHQTLSEESVYMRYASILKYDQRVAHERLSRLCFIDYDREMALVAERTDPETGEESIIAVVRLTKLYSTNDGEFALIIQDDFQGQGLGTELLRQIIQVAREEELEHLTADILWQNRAMQHLSKKMGFEILRNDDASDPMVKAVLTL